MVNKIGTNNYTRKQFLILGVAAAGAGVLASSGFGGIASAQSSDLLHRRLRMASRLCERAARVATETASGPSAAYAPGPRPASHAAFPSRSMWDPRCRS